MNGANYEISGYRLRNYGVFSLQINRQSTANPILNGRTCAADQQVSYKL